MNYFFDKTPWRPGPCQLSKKRTEARALSYARWFHARFGVRTLVRFLRNYERLMLSRCFINEVIDILTLFRRMVPHKCQFNSTNFLGHTVSLVSEFGLYLGTSYYRGLDFPTSPTAHMGMGKLDFHRSVWTLRRPAVVRHNFPRCRLARCWDVMYVIERWLYLLYNMTWLNMARNCSNGKSLNIRVQVGLGDIFVTIIRVVKCLPLIHTINIWQQSPWSLLFAHKCHMPCQSLIGTRKRHR